MFFLDIFTVKKRLRDYRREMGKVVVDESQKSGLFGRSGKVVLMAVGMLVHSQFNILLNKQ